jgi:hypothetical protein
MKLSWTTVPRDLDIFPLQTFFFSTDLHFLAKNIAQYVKLRVRAGKHKH